MPSRHAQDAVSPVTLLTLSVVVCLSAVGPADVERLTTPASTRPTAWRQEDEAVHTLLASLTRAVRQVCQKAQSVAVLMRRPDGGLTEIVQRPVSPVLLPSLDHVGLHLLNLPPPAMVV